MLTGSRRPTHFLSSWPTSISFLINVVFPEPGAPATARIFAGFFRNFRQKLCPDGKGKLGRILDNDFFDRIWHSGFLW